MPGLTRLLTRLQRSPDAAAKHTGSEIPRLRRRALAKSLDYYRDQFDDRKSGIVATYATGDYTLQAIADAFGVHYATGSRTIIGK
jgi:putative transposase